MSERQRVNIQLPDAFWLRIIALPILVSLVVTVAVVKLTADNTTTKAQREATAIVQTAATSSCRRGNISRSFFRRGEVLSSKQIQRSPYEIDLATDLFPILDCDDTTKTGRERLLRADVQVRYIEMVLLECRLPTVHDGEIRGSRTLPGGCPMLAFRRGR